nr:class D sortase [Virgibacillus siamensis]
MGSKIKLFAIALIAFGLVFGAWNTYEWWKSSQSVKAIDVSASTGKKDLSKREKRTISKKQQNDSGSGSGQKGAQTSKTFSTLKGDFSRGKHVAELIIPEIDSAFEVYWGTGTEALRKGVGMYVSEWTTVPNLKGGHTVLSGHRDTVFTELGELEEGDSLSLEFKGKTYYYQITKIWITDPDDRTVIVKKDESILTLTTCYPFNYVGSAPKRYIIQSKLIK